MLPTSLERFDTKASLQRSVADQMADYLRDCVSRRGVASVSLSGGSTPKRIYELLAEMDLPWDQIHWFWGDERNVSADDEQSNFRMVRLALLDPAKVPAAQIHPVETNLSDPAAAARDYENKLRSFFSGQSMPVWDLVLLGMGDDGHTASLFPHTRALAERERWFTENWVEKFDAYRYTLSAPAIAAGRERWFLITGAEKREALQNVLNSETSADDYPAKMIMPTRLLVTEETLPVSA
ncbi:MAG: 6-phosphogluconolactonase [Planctomycetota bacterium]